MSGHSKWANIRRRKESVDRKRGTIFTKLSRELMIAARLGGSDPGMNGRLRIAVSKARSGNMPLDTIERAIKKGSGELSGQTFEEVTYEIYAPGGVGVIVEAMTDKKSRTTPEIKNILTKHNWNLAEANAVSRLFQVAGFMLVKTGDFGEEELMELALEAGAEDLRTTDEYYEILTAPGDYARVAETLADKNIATEESGVRFLPLEGTEVAVGDVEVARKLFKVLDLIEEHDDVQTVFHNMQVSDEVGELL